MTRLCINRNGFFVLQQKESNLFPGNAVFGAVFHGFMDIIIQIIVQGQHLDKALFQRHGGPVPHRFHIKCMPPDQWQVFSFIVGFFFDFWSKKYRNDAFS